MRLRRRPRLNARSAIAIVSLVLLGLTACSSDEDSLVVYSGRSESLVGPLIERFEEENGLDVRVRYAGSPGLAATLLEEGSNSPADVFFAQDPSSLGAVAPMLDTLPAAILESVPVWARSPEGRWVGVSGRARVVVFNRESLDADDLPDSLEGFTDPQWKGRIGWAPGNASFQTMVGAMREMWGDDKTREWLDQIVANDPKQFPNNTTIVAATADGEVDVGFVNHYYLFRFLQEDGEDFGARNKYLTSAGPGSIIMVAGAGVLSSSDNKDAAGDFVSFLLSRDAQEYFASETFEYPLVSGVSAESLLVPLAQIDAPDVDVSSLEDITETQRFLRDAGIIP